MADETPIDPLKGTAAPETTDGASPQSSPDVASGAAAPVAGGVAGKAATMRDEIRGQLERDLAASSKRLDERFSRAADAPQPSHVPATCWSCHGTSRCWWCKGAGCASCYGGACSTCRGSGSV